MVRLQSDQRQHYFGNILVCLSLFAFFSYLFVCFVSVLISNLSQGKRKRHVGSSYCEEDCEETSDIIFQKVPWRMPTRLSPRSPWGEYYANNKFLW